MNSVYGSMGPGPYKKNNFWPENKWERAFAVPVVTFGSIILIIVLLDVTGVLNWLM